MDEDEEIDYEYKPSEEIEKLELKIPTKWSWDNEPYDMREPSNTEIAEKVNEIIEKLNKLITKEEVK
jgi:hypothetical protein